MTREQMIEVMKSAGNVTTKQAEAQLLALEAAGQRVVPVEATEDMLVAGTEDWLCERAMEDRAAACYTAMLSAAPGAPHE